MDIDNEMGKLEQHLLNSSVFWYIGYTISPLDKKAVKDLEKMGVFVYVPCHKIDKVFRGRMSTLMFALYPHYVFLGIDDEEKFSKARHSDRIIDILQVDDKPYLVDASIIEKIYSEELAMINDDTAEADKKHRRKGIGAEVGSSVLIKEGALEGKTGTITFKRGARIWVVLAEHLLVQIKLKSVQVLSTV